MGKHTGQQVREWQLTQRPGNERDEPRRRTVLLSAVILSGLESPDNEIYKNARATLERAPERIRKEVLEITGLENVESGLKQTTARGRKASLMRR